MEIVQEIVQILELISCLSNKDFNDVNELLDHNEWGIAFELLCSALFQDKIQISQEAYEKIENAGKVMELDYSLWEVLRPLVK